MKHPAGQGVIEKMNIADIKQRYVWSDLKAYIENHLITIVSGFMAIVFMCVASANGLSVQAFFGNEIYFISNTPQNTFDFTYLITAVGLFIMIFLGEKKLVSFMQVIGKVYILASLIGLMRIGSYNYSEWFSLMNFVLGFFMVVAGKILRDYRHSLLVTRLIGRQRQAIDYLIMDTIKNSDFRYSVLKKNSDNGEIYGNEDSSDTSFIRGEFI